jgi:polyribonucleotide nucleotidyltransferase
MDAGVPIVSPVSGIAMGVIVESESEFAVFSDISGIEDFNGDMDFKVAGTKKGITAMQLDVKTLSLSIAIVGKAIEQAKSGRLFILESMLKTLDEPRTKVSTYAPKIKTLRIDPEKIGELIGPGGKTIKRIIAETGAEVEVEDDGVVSISGLDDEAVKKAIEWVESITKEVQAGEIYKGVVKRIQPFGAFVAILPGKEGLVHVSDMSEAFVKDPEEIVKLGQEIQVRVKEIDAMGRINLSMILDQSREKPRRDFSRNRDQTGKMGRGRDNNRRDNRQKSGPHFPASRLYPSTKKENFGR